MRTILALIQTIGLACLLLIPVMAQQTQEIIIGTDDVLEIIVTNHEELNKTVTVLGDGTITMSEVGTITAAGKSPRELAAIIKTALQKTRNKVEVLVSPKEIHSRRARVLGVVRMPGQYDIKSDWRVMDLVDAAGGLNVKITHVSGRIIRNRSDVVSLDLPRADLKRDSEYNVPLQRDDVVLLDEIDLGHSQVIVMGSVGKPGTYPLDDQTTVLSLITEAGNPTDKAALSGAYVTRDTRQIPLNLVSTFKGKYDPEVANFKLRSGDWLYIPESTVHISVMGHVARPGFYPIPETGEVTVIDALNLAGGSSGGNTAKAGILRTVNGKPTVIPVDIDKMLKTADMKQNVALQPNDVLLIPASSAHKFNLGDLMVPATLLSLLAAHL